MFNKSRYSEIKYNQVKNCIFNFLNFQELFIIRNLNKQSRDLLEKYQKNFSRLTKILPKLKDKKINTLQKLIKEEHILNQIFSTKEVFYHIFDYLLKEDQYEFDFKEMTKFKEIEYNIVLEGLKKTEKIKHLKISGIKYMDEREKILYKSLLENLMKDLMEILKHNKSITSLDLSYNNIGSNLDDIKYLEEVLKHNQSIKSLNLSGKSIGYNPYKIKQIAEALKYNQSIISLDLSDNFIGSNPDNIKYLAEALKYNQSIISMDLRNNIIGSDPDDIKYLAEALKYNQSIKSLDLSDNIIGSDPDDIKYLAEALKYNQSITSLDLSDNSIGSNPDNIKYLAEVLKHNKSITSLNLSENNIESNPDNIKYLAEVLKHNQSITSLYLSDKSPINPLNTDFIEKNLKYNQFLLNTDKN